MTREQVRSVMGKPYSIQEAYEKWGINFPDKDYFIENAFQVEYSAEGSVCFIEVSQHESYEVIFEGVDVHRAEPISVIRRLEELDKPNREDREYPCNQTFEKICVSLYREHSEEDNIDAFGISTRDYRAC